MTTQLTIKCPPMAVRNTSWWNPLADRITDELACPSQVVLPDGSTVDFTHVFPQCYVRRLSAGKWMVDAVVSKSNSSIGPFILFPSLAEGVNCSISWPQEPVDRDGKNMLARAIDSMEGTITVTGKTGKVKAHMPQSVGRPVGMGMYVFVVDAVTITGTVEWE